MVVDMKKMRDLEVACGIFGEVSRSTARYVLQPSEDQSRFRRAGLSFLHDASALARRHRPSPGPAPVSPGSTMAQAQPAHSLRLLLAAPSNTPH